MAAENPMRRKKSAKELADKHGCSTRTIRRKIAEPRDDYVARAAAQRERAQQMRADGASYRAIADELGVPIGSVSSLLHVRQTSKAG
ncbi:HTH domain-containing protein [Nocardia yunnanensis]|uniref:HTH domain-containing protein n=1 Tax=Nocardia yunnanensis TaxID=2382165 RepID=A0A386ZKN3_9NOCA|nr:HTH domain-containing protein [Nocardia yunnanensis]AYF78141.1 HTH domain-containing protein [Nocardia yunnanensis]